MSIPRDLINAKTGVSLKGAKPKKLGTGEKITKESCKKPQVKGNMVLLGKRACPTKQTHSNLIQTRTLTKEKRGAKERCNM